jgi:hypothetical protein
MDLLAAAAVRLRGTIQTASRLLPEDLTPCLRESHSVNDASSHAAAKVLRNDR